MNWITTVIVDLESGTNIKIGDKVTGESGREEFSGEITHIEFNFREPVMTIELDRKDDYVKVEPKFRNITTIYIQTLNGKPFNIK
jgi:hypothetical protein